MIHCHFHVKNFVFVVVLTGMEVEDKDLFTFEDEVTIHINTTVLIRLNGYFHTGNVSEMKSYEERMRSLQLYFVYFRSLLQIFLTFLLRRLFSFFNWEP